MATSGRQDFSIPLQAGPARAQSCILYNFFFVLGGRTCSAYIISIKIIINSEVKFRSQDCYILQRGVGALIGKSCGREIKGHKNALKVIIIAFTLVLATIPDQRLRC